MRSHEPILEPECPGPDCLSCNGSACGLCGAGCWNHSADLACEHDVIDRHADGPVLRDEALEGRLPEFVTLAQSAAHAEGVTVSEWWRRAARERLGLPVVTR